VSFIRNCIVQVEIKTASNNLLYQNVQMKKNIQYY